MSRQNAGSTGASGSHQGRDRDQCGSDGSWQDQDRDPGLRSLSANTPSQDGGPAGKILPGESSTSKKKNSLKVRSLLTRKIVNKVLKPNLDNPKGATGKTKLPGQGLDQDDQDFSHSKLEDNTLAWLIVNMRGWASKRVAFNNIVKSSDIDVFGITETHTTTNKVSVEGCSIISRNRSNKNSKGGVAIGVRSKLADHAIKVFEGSGSNECLMVKLTCFEPAVIFGIYYGCQEGTTPPDVIRANLDETFKALEKYNSQGLKIIMGGDFNAHVGEYVIGNDKKISKAGQYLVDLCNVYGFTIANNMLKTPSHTHFDVSSKTSRVLDLVLTNSKANITDIQVDTAKNLTPYRICYNVNSLNNNGPTSRKYTDHLAIFGETKVSTAKRERKPKIKIWNYKKKGAKAKFQHYTNIRADEAIRHIVEQPNCERVLEEVTRLLQEAKYDSFEIRTVTQKKLLRDSDENLALRRVNRGFLGGHFLFLTTIHL